MQRSTTPNLKDDGNEIHHPQERCPKFASNTDRSLRTKLHDKKKEGREAITA